MTGGWSWVVTKFFFYPGLALLVMGVTSAAGSTRIVDTWNTIGGQLLVSIGGFGFLAEFAGVCGRIFGAEIHGRTAQQIITLPVSVAQIGYQKIAGGLLALLPAFSMIVVGMSFDHRSAVALSRFVTTSEGFAAVVAYLVFVHICVYLSIHIRTGAVVLAFFMMWMAAITWNVLLLAMVGAQAPQRQENLALVISTIGIVACVFLQWRIASDVKRKATM